MQEAAIASPRSVQECCVGAKLAREDTSAPEYNGCLNTMCAWYRDHCGAKAWDAQNVRDRHDQ